ncbi:MAG: hypothetical protein HYV27_01375 [Candidatus Hydrogenedentes bacterium]|nr:hypothetical protein [Candidatus Hydrogenedentota bacterium]
MNRTILGLLTAAACLAGCGGQTATAPEAPAAAEVAAAPQAIPMTNLAAIKIGPYDVQPMYEEELKDGHLNTRIAGGEVAAVRVWVGPEDATGVMVVKTEIENDYHHGHVEMPNPIPAGAKLWIEIETPTGERLKGSTPLNG